MYNIRKINYVLLEEALNSLLADDAIRARRYGQVNMVKEKLLGRVRAGMREMGFTDAHRAAFLQGEPESVKLLSELAAGLLPQRKLALFLAMLRRQDEDESTAKYGAALSALEDHLLYKEQIRFREECKLSTKVWKGFYNSTAISGPKTLQAIQDGLKLTEEERARFDALAIPEVFPANDPLKREVHTRRKNTGMSILEFLNFAFVGKDAWEAFYPIPGEEDGSETNPSPAPRNTSQDTLLKLLIGFGLGESDARALLALAGSDFILLRDLVFLVSIRTGFGHPDLMPEILDYFSEGEDGEPRYVSPYARII